MRKIDDLIQELCPEGVEYRELQLIGKRNHGTSITATQMKGIHKVGGEVRIFAGGNTIADVSLNDIPLKDIIWEPSIIVKSRGYIDFVYYDRPFSHKNELWSYTINIESVNQKFVYYYLITHKERLQEVARATSVKIPQLSVADTDNLSVPLPPLPIQEEIVRILDKFTKLEAELEAELEARKKQYDYYRNQLLSPIEKDGKWYMNGNEVEWKTLGEVCVSLRKGTLKRGQLVEDGAYPVINSGREWYGFYESYNNEADALIIAARGEYAGFVSYISTKFWAGGLCYPYRSIKEDVVHTKFIYYYLKNNEQSIMDVLVSRGSIPAINKSDVDRIQIPIPPLSEQERIVSILDRFDALVNDISIGLPAEIEARRKQYEYYRGKLLSFKNIADRAEA